MPVLYQMEAGLRAIAQMWSKHHLYPVLLQFPSGPTCSLLVVTSIFRSRKLYYLCYIQRLKQKNT